MKVKFHEVLVGQQFTFADDTDSWLGLCEKVDSNHYTICANRRIVVKLGNTIKLCILH